MSRSAECSAITQSDADEASEPQPPSSERRRTRRHIEIELTLQSESNLYWGLGENVSSGGVFIATHMTERVGAEIEIGMTLSPLGKTMRATGIVRWVREFSEQSEAPAGMGVQLEGLGSEEITLIQAFAAARPPLFFEVG
jgi:uncharacterized protein (TIGR02266 family)